MNLLVIGGGGREHAITWKLKQSRRVEEIYICPGNAGTEKIAQNVNLDCNDFSALISFVKEKDIDLTFVGPEAPLVAGIVDEFEKHDLKIFGCNKRASQLEGSKVFAKNFMKKNGIPTAGYRVFSEYKTAVEYVDNRDDSMVIKADGLAAGKGVIVAHDKEEAKKALKKIMLDKEFGSAGNRVVIEEFLPGEEATILAFTDGETIMPMSPSQDHKPAYEGGKGPNTGGMGAYAPAPIIGREEMDKLTRDIIVPTLKGLKKEGIKYKGIIYFGLMLSNNKIRVLEYNVRFGDPETQVILPLLKTDLVDIAEAVISEELDKVNVEWSTKKSLCVIMASGGYPISYETGKVITGIEEVNSLKDTAVFQAGTSRKDGELVTDGGRVLGVTVLGDDFKENIDRAYCAIEKIDFEDAHYRKDIGQKALEK